MGVSNNKGTPKWMVNIMENPIENGWFGGTIFFWKHPYTHTYQKKSPKNISDQQIPQQPQLF